MSPDQELQVLFPAIGINGITVKPFKFKDFRSVLGIAKKYIEIFSTLKDSTAVIMTMLDRGEDALDDLAKLANLATGLSLEEIGELEGDKAMDLFFAVFEINSDFFIQKLTEGAEKIAARLAPKGGLSKSPNSFAMDTDSRTLESTAKPR